MSDEPTYPRATAIGDLSPTQDPARQNPTTWGGVGAATTAAQDPLIGADVIGQYRIVSKVGEGGMGLVYRAEQPAMKRDVAIKVLHPWLSADASVAARFHSEALSIARLQNPHIVSVFNYGTMASGHLFLAMELLDGRTLSEELRQLGRLPPERAVEITTQACDALSEAHRHNIIHRDLKPSNIMLLHRAAGRDFTKLLDFGIAKVDSSGMTQQRGWVGTPQYMSPEQISNGDVDPRTDIYSLGIILYEMLCGRPPFVSDNQLSYIHAHVYDVPPPVTSFAPAAAIPPALATVTMRALNKDPKDRPASAEAFAQELHAAMRGRADATAARRRAGPSPLAIALAAGAVGVIGTAVTFAVLSGAFGGDDMEEVAQAAPAVAEDDDPPRKKETKEKRDAPPKKDEDEDEDEDEAEPEKPETKPKEADEPPPAAEEKKPKFDPELVALLDEEERALLEKTLDELEKDADEVIAITTPPSYRKEVKKQYLLAVGMSADETTKYITAARFIGSMRRTAETANMPPADKSLAELEKEYISLFEGAEQEDAKKNVELNRENIATRGEDGGYHWRIALWLWITDRKKELDAKANAEQAVGDAPAPTP